MPGHNSVTPELIRQVTSRVFHVPRGVVKVAFGLIHFTLGLQLLVIHRLAGGFLDAAFSLISSALDVFSIHRWCLPLSDDRGRSHNVPGT